MESTWDQIAELSDDDLYENLKQFKPDCGPIVGTTRPLYQKLLLSYCINHSPPPAEEEVPIVAHESSAPAVISQEAISPGVRIERVLVDDDEDMHEADEEDTEEEEEEYNYEDEAEAEEDEDDVQVIEQEDESHMQLQARMMDEQNRLQAAKAMSRARQMRMEAEAGGPVDTSTWFFLNSLLVGFFAVIIALIIVLSLQDRWA